MCENNIFLTDCPKIRIKPSLHILKSDKIVTKRLAQNGSTTDRNKHSLPFRVNHNQLMPQLQQISSHINHSNNPIVSQNGLNKTEYNVFRNEPLNRCTSCPPSQSPQVWPQTQCLNGMNLNLNNQPISERSVSQSLGLNWSRSENQFEDIQNSSDLIQSKVKTSLNGVFDQTNRIYNSCPSSPVLHRFEPNIIQSFNSMNRKNICIKFHELHGSGVILSSDLTQVERCEDSSLTSNYAFIGQQLRIGFEITVQIIESDELKAKQSFIFGVTNTNPSMLTEADLPDNPELLLQRRAEVWNLVDQFCDNCKLNDKLTLRVDSKGFLSFGINSKPHSLLYPIQVHNLWPFFVLIGRIKAIKLIDNSCDSPPIKPMRENRLKINCFNRNSSKHLYLCINCRSNYANTAFYRCGHKYYCHSCALFVLNSSKKCPICRQYIFDLLIVFP